MSSRLKGYPKHLDKVEYQSWIKYAFKVTDAKGHVQKFSPCEKGLYHWKAPVAKKTVQFGTLLAITTVEGNKAKHSAEDIQKAEKAL